MELWRECLAWLNRFKMIPKDHPVHRQEAGPQDLLGLLRDGVVLCQLVHCLDPTSVDMTKVTYTSHSPHEAEAVSDFTCRNNIFLFLYAIVNNFDLDADDHFFDPKCLYEYKDIAKVLRTLSALSHSDILSKSLVPGFPKKEKKLEKMIEVEEKIYGNLRELYASGNNESIYGQVRFAGKSPIKQEFKDDVYDDIYQTICSPKKSRMSLDISFSKKNKREYPIKEFMDSEDKYLANLIMVREHFQNQLTQLSYEQLELLFGNWASLIQLHSNILLDLKQRKCNIGEVIVKNKDGFEAYKNYVCNLSVAQEMLNAESQQCPKLKKELNKCQIKAKSPFPLTAHIVLPFQRLLKYHIMMKEILKHTPETHEEYADLQEAHDFMVNFNNSVNDAKRDMEENDAQLIQDEKDLNIIEHVQRSIKSMQLPNHASLRDFGRLRRAGDLKVVNVNGEVTDYVFLFDTIMLMCNRPGIMQQRYRFKYALKLKDYRIQEPATAGNNNGILLYHRMNLFHHPLTLVAKSSRELDLWLQSLLQSMDALYPSENFGVKHELILTNFGGDNCSHCGKKFLGIFAQGYRCRTCNSILHKGCIGERGCLGREGKSPMKRSGSIALPTFIDRSSITSSTLSLAPTKRSSTDMNETLMQLQDEIDREQALIPMEKQDWFGGNIDIRRATDRLRELPTGTFLVRRKDNPEVEEFALDLKTKGGVKHMKIFSENDENCGKVYFFSAARSFPSVSRLISYYRKNDLLENFSYKGMEGISLKIPFKNA